MNVSIKYLNKKKFKLPLFVALCNGIGSGGGVAWSLNGILFSLIGCAVGSGLSILLGGLSLALFLGIAIFIFVFSFKDMQKKEQSFHEKFHANEQSLLDAILVYNRLVPANNLEGRGLESKDLSPALRQLLCSVNQKNTGNSLSSLQSKELVEAYIIAMPLTPVPLHKLLVPALFGFIGTVGSLIGCSAGVTGLLTGVGLFTTFAAVPILGWGLICFALIAGVIIGAGVGYGRYVTIKRKEVQKNLQALTKELHAHNYCLEHHVPAFMNRAQNTYQHQTKPGLQAHPNFFQPNKEAVNHSNEGRPMLVRSNTF